VEEAKEIPAVKVLDTAVVPTKKTYPPRLQVMILGTLMSLTVAVVWIFVRRWWNGIAAEDPGRQLIEEIWASGQTSARRFVPEGGFVDRVVTRMRRRQRGGPVPLEDDAGMEKAREEVSR
jgi:hypothetical protein